MTEAHTSQTGERIAKRIARAGICSRRDAERLIAEGKVSLDGKVLTSPAVLVTELSVIKVAGKLLPTIEATRLWRYHKPKGVVTTHKDPQRRPTLFERLPPDLPRVISIGRLDLNSEGLLLLTNDGALARRLELPSNGWLRRYRVRVHGTIDPRALLQLAKGVTVDGVTYGGVEATLDSTKGANSWLTMSLKEGKNREIRKLVEHLGADVNRLIRLSYGPFQLGYLEPGQVEEVPAPILRDQIGAGAGAPPAREKRKPRTAKPDAK
jgi:23S rRNA pseudouridine2605 synthase